VHLDNLRAAGHIDGLPKGMLPMCYPSDANGEYIPQWGMWYVLELEEALSRSSRIDAEQYRTLCYDMVEHFTQYENEDGLLERMPHWGFVEWSKCNEWIQDVNYPTAFLYSRFLKAVGTMYKDDALLKKGRQVREAALRLSFDGQLFTDNAVRDESGILRNTGNTSETAQYYAIHFGELNLEEERFAFLKNAFEDVFGCDHQKYASLGREIAPSNAFMGIYLRLECLLERGMYDKVLTEIKGFFGGMAELTGTLWEHDNVHDGSLNHGFASYVAVAMLQAMGR
jgi:alpha-L-rhamnosidase